MRRFLRSIICRLVGHDDLVMCWPDRAACLWRCQRCRRERVWTVAEFHARGMRP